MKRVFIALSISLLLPLPGLPVAVLAQETPATAAGDPSAAPPADAAEPVNPPEQAEYIVLDDVIAWVNEEAVTQSDLELEMERRRMELAQREMSSEDQIRLLEEAQPQVLDAMLERLLVLQEGKARGLRVTDFELQRFVDNFIQENEGIESEEDLDRALKSVGSSLERFKEETEMGIMMEKVRQQLVYPRVRLSEAAIRDYYFAHQEDYRLPAFVQLQEIFLKTTEFDREQVKQRAGELVASLRSGTEDFGETAKVVSDSLSADLGGDLGRIELDSLNESLHRVVANLAIGEISSPIESPTGFQILKVLDKQQSSFQPLLDVREEILTRLRQEKRSEELKKYIEELRGRAYIKIYREDLQ